MCGRRYPDTLCIPLLRRLVGQFSVKHMTLPLFGGKADGRRGTEAGRSDAGQGRDKHGAEARAAWRYLEFEGESENVTSPVRL